MIALMYVTYAGNETTRFDRDYYFRKHLPIVREAWSRHGLLSCDAFFPAQSNAGTIVIAECRFYDRSAMLAALACPETQAVMDDIAQFTDVRPFQHVPTPVQATDAA